MRKNIPYLGCCICAWRSLLKENTEKNWGGLEKMRLSGKPLTGLRLSEMHHTYQREGWESWNAQRMMWLRWEGPSGSPLGRVPRSLRAEGTGAWCWWGSQAKMAQVWYRARILEVTVFKTWYLPSVGGFLLTGHIEMEWIWACVYFEKHRKREMNLAQPYGLYCARCLTS